MLTKISIDTCVDDHERGTTLKIHFFCRILSNRAFGLVRQQLGTLLTMGQILLIEG